MTSEVYNQKTVVEILKSNHPTFSAEIIPPRNGTETEQILRQIEALKNVGVDFISVTKGAGGSLRGGTLPIAQLVKSRFEICSLAHFTCRDYTIEEIENTLMDHHYFGVNNILALRGDPPDGKPDHFKPAPNRHIFAYELVKQIQELNQGQYLVRDGFDSPSATAKRPGTPTKFCIGVAAHPEHTPHEQGVDYLVKKIDAGANFAITQMIFDDVPYKRFLDSLKKVKKEIPILPGIRVVTQAATAERMMKKFGCNIPEKLLSRLQKATSKEEGRQIGIEFSLDLCRRFLAAGAPGIHFFVMSDESTSCEVITKLRLK